MGRCSLQVVMVSKLNETCKFCVWRRRLRTTDPSRSTVLSLFHQCRDPQGRESQPTVMLFKNTVRHWVDHDVVKCTSPTLIQQQRPLAMM